MYGRLADALIYLSSEHFKDEDIFSLVTRKDISEFAGLSTETTIRLLNEFKNEGIIKLEGKRIVIINIKSLKKISSCG